MKRALVLYNSKTGTTQRFAEEIGGFLVREGTALEVKSIFKFDPHDLDGVDIVLLGCWTSGLMIILQRPERTWVEFAKTLPNLHRKKIALFTAYALATGTMFSGMKKHLRCNAEDIVLALKSRNGHLTDNHRKQLTSLLHEGEPQ